MLETSAQQHKRQARFCHLCGAQLLGRYYQASTGLVFCAECHARRPRCARCGIPLDDSAIARNASAPSGEPPLCRDCQRTTPRCAACRCHITGPFYTFEELVPPAAVRRFCESCVKQRPRCDLCDAPVSPDAAPLDDGQYRCSLCASEMVLGQKLVRDVYDQALAAFARVVSPRLSTIPELEIVGRLQMGDIRRRYEHMAASGRKPASHGDHHVLGFFVRAHGASTIYVERGLPRGLLLGTLAHELGHAWQAERTPSLRDPLLCEGFAEWVAHHVLIASGLRPMAARATRRDDVYGRGLRHFLALEQQSGREAVLTLAQGR
jgi:hypothetical protein